MSVEIVYRVVKTNGELAGEYMDKKLADAHDQKLDCIYTLVELMLEKSSHLDEASAEKIAEHLVDNKAELMSALKKVKDVPAVDIDANKVKTTGTVIKGESSNDDNVNALESNKRAIAG